MKPRPGPLLAAALAFSALLGPVPAGAQGSGRPPIDPIRAAVEVTAMDLDVIALKGGEPVTDMRQEEFVVKVDGKVCPLDYFTRVEGGALSNDSEAKLSPSLALDVAPAKEGETPVLIRHFLIFLDDEHLRQFDRRRAVNALKGFVDLLQPNDRVALVKYGGTSHVITPFTSSRQALVAALNQADTGTARGEYWGVQNQLDLQSAEIRARETGTLRDLRRAVSALAARPGKRILIYVSNGLELHPPAVAFPAPNMQGPIRVTNVGTGATSSVPVSGLRSPFGTEYPSLWELYRDVIKEANRSGVTIHAIDARGLMASDNDASTSTDNRAEPADTFERIVGRREALTAFTDETGGVMIQDRNVVPATLQQVYREATTYYSLGTTVANIGDAKKEHKVTVTTTRPGVTIRARTSYAVKPVGQAAKDSMEMALLTPGATGDFEVLIQASSSRKAKLPGRRIVPVEILVPMSALTFSDERGRRKALIDVTVAATDETDGHSDFKADRQTIVLEPGHADRERRGAYHYEAELQIRTGNTRLVIAVRDVATGRTGLASLPVHVD